MTISEGIGDISWTQGVFNRDEVEWGGGRRTGAEN